MKRAQTILCASGLMFASFVLFGIWRLQGWDVKEALGHAAHREFLLGKAEYWLSSALSSAKNDDAPPERIGDILETLGEVYESKEEYKKAEQFFLEGLSFYEKTLRPNHPKIADGASHLGRLYLDLNRYREAEPYLARALAIDEETLKPDTERLERDLENMALLLVSTGNRQAAEILLERSLALSQAEIEDTE